jgi:protein-tyrosine phosphatase
MPPLNFRDIGGLPTTTGALTRRDVLYRSDTLYADDDVTTLGRVWPPAVVIDLRRKEERTDLDLAWTGSTEVHRLGILDPALTRSSATLAELYPGLLDASGATIAGVVAVAAHSPGPVLVHCAAGKDRTGIVVATLLGAAGVTREAVVADYLATGASGHRRRDRVAAQGLELRRTPVPVEFYDVSAGAIEGVLDVLDTAGGPTAWLQQHGARADDLAAWTTRLVGTA